MTFDGILNVTLSQEEVSTTLLHREILNSSCVLILLIHIKHKYKKMKSWTDLTSSFQGDLIHLVEKAKSA